MMNRVVATKWNSKWNILSNIFVSLELWFKTKRFIFIFRTPSVNRDSIKNKTSFSKDRAIIFFFKCCNVSIIQRCAWIMHECNASTFFFI